MRYRNLFVFVLCIGIATLGAIQIAHAQPRSLVPCVGADECTVCDLVALGKNIIDFFVYASVIMATLLFINAGVLYVTSPGNPGNISRAHRIFSNTLVGIIIILTSWIVVDFGMKALYGGSQGETRWGPWNEILCKPGQAGVAPPAPAAPAPVGSAAPPAGNALCSDRAALAQRYGVPNNTTLNSPNVTRLINCYRQDANVARIACGPGNTFTYELQNPLCNLTRGNSVCGACVHRAYSCHYGGVNGVSGAEAVDFNACNGTEAELNAAIRDRRAVCGGNVLFESDHTHISTQQCGQS